ncbi:hypothetical protein E3O45_02440 [Cryobacterium sp. TMS1-20-1]|uniref:Transposase n=1 Tax=Cryobacterium levicorallinum TaxID=995038 RepID=A0A4R8VKU0_9MICO|nr:MULTISPECIES: transposase [unclassified Cryobacterium]TFB83983.1 hypothetical protein E3O11_10325 [Cryobacterium levicorallinum]TFC80294.1 hypothetical protein E3O45_02440 [Cryobacterium sp. TMS1-20-1]TFD07931.1 hypothetical protein E3T35_18120 [Cryobacterium sp. TMT1-2-2]TFD61946.1 hypothetical protein E3T41_07165 [Cryobacterium sp. Hh38]
MNELTSNEKKPKRSFSPQFRAEAVQLVITTGRPNKHVADELGITDQSLGLWVKQFNAENEARSVAAAAEPMPGRCQPL